MPMEQTKEALLNFGYTLKAIECLFEHEPDIDSLEDALLKLEKTKMGYMHKFVGLDSQDMCRICQQK